LGEIGYQSVKVAIKDGLVDEKDLFSQLLDVESGKILFFFFEIFNDFEANSSFFFFLLERQFFKSLKISQLFLIVSSKLFSVV
jgi:hypothetical protein